MAAGRSAEPPAGGIALVMTRVLEAPRELVFRLWASPEHLARWWGPRDDEGRDFTAPSVELDFRPGGRYRICIRSPQGREYWHGGVYQEIIEPERLSFTFQWEEEGAPVTLVEVSLAEHGAGQTLLTFRQSGFENEASRDGHEGGWSECMDRLGAYAPAVAVNLGEHP
ncbi:SRPBCC domain-containing protein [Schlegelella sp. S2-27]|uniref:SRPBCC domain-containing protein n=1 Tax=Caldimonas mangrovi TaxID=2944811 RepID=A0ABT0YN51_9BURK|nr:SRPBCC domain-containing protein [Caldimonas mangrovi]MCM5679591.1 SRPBCC domain-containing protein [Caldimonas mangrovi]